MHTCTASHVRWHLPTDAQGIMSNDVMLCYDVQQCMIEAYALDMYDTVLEHAMYYLYTESHASVQECSIQGML